MTHLQAVVAMIAASALWGIAGLVSRQLQSHEGLEITFWRSVFAALTVALWLAAGRDLARVRATLRGGAPVWISGAMWAVMFTCFMVSLSLTTVANVLIVQCLAPVFTAALGRLVLGRRIAWTGWLSIAVASLGVASMYVFDLAALDARQSLGVLIALGIPSAAAVNWVLLQRTGARMDLSAAIMIGGTLSALVTLPFAWPLGIAGRDLAWLALLGVAQLAVPCLLLMRAAQVLMAYEVALLALLEVVFGIGFVWLFAGERPPTVTLIGGAALLAALVFNELMRPAKNA
jgi:drug/metabolite transporter (DMT)-like permease